MEGILLSRSAQLAYELQNSDFVFSLMNKTLILDGLWPEVRGYGEANFANHVAPYHNAVLVRVWKREFPNCIFVARKWIYPHDEIFVNYGQGYAKRCLMTRDPEMDPNSEAFKMCIFSKVCNTVLH